MKIPHVQNNIPCSEVFTDEESSIFCLTGASARSLVERRAVVSGGSLNDSVVSGKVVLINCKVYNAVVTGAGILQNETITGELRINQKREAKKRTKYTQEYLFPVETSQLPNNMAVENY